MDVIREHALGLLGRRGYSRGELAQRLASRGYDRGTIDILVDRLAAWGLVDDEAYAREVARTILRRKPASAELIEQKLIARRLPTELARRIAAETLADVDAVEAATRLALSCHRARSPEADRRRIGSALARRGFDADVIREVVERLERQGFSPPDDDDGST